MSCCPATRHVDAQLRFLWHLISLANSWLLRCDIRQIARDKQSRTAQGPWLDGDEVAQSCRCSMEIVVREDFAARSADCQAEGLQAVRWTMKRAPLTAELGGWSMFRDRSSKWSAFLILLQRGLTRNSQIQAPGLKFNQCNQRSLKLDTLSDLNDTVPSTHSHTWIDKLESFRSVDNLIEPGGSLDLIANSPSARSM